MALNEVSYPQESLSQPKRQRFRCERRECEFRCDSEALMLMHLVNHQVSEENRLDIYADVLGYDRDDDDEQPQLDQEDEGEIEILGPDKDSIENEDTGEDPPQRKVKAKKSNKKVKRSKDRKKEVIYKCPICERKFSKDKIRLHIYVHTSENPHRCKACGICYMQANSLKEHAKIHQGFKPVSCETCGVGFASKKSLAKHRITHSSDRVKSHICNHCEMRFYDKETLKQHFIRIHLPKESRQFKCDFEGCRYSAVFRHQLQEHQKVHKDEKPFQCDQCDYSAKTKWTLKKHYRKHTQEKPFKCKFCPYSCTLSSNMRRHLRVHTGSKPFKCPYCDYSCNTHENLRKHVLNTKKHQGLKMYVCDQAACDFSTNVFQDWRKHLEENHSDVFSPEQIEKMSSNVYNKQEDIKAKRYEVVTTKKRKRGPVVPLLENADFEILPHSEGTVPTTYLIRETSQGTSGSTQQIVVMHPVTFTTHSGGGTHHGLEDYTHLEYIPVESEVTVAGGSNNPSEVIVVDSGVLEAQEVCVPGQAQQGRLDMKSEEIVIAFSTVS